jgi:hypothetical protein
MDPRAVEELCNIGRYATTTQVQCFDSGEKEANDGYLGCEELMKKIHELVSTMISQELTHLIHELMPR